jgi:hypothetical protein
MSTRAEVKGAVTCTMCSVCGTADWDSCWMGITTVAVCRRCALEVLPRLIADAIFEPTLPPNKAHAALRDVECEFWRALALAFAR